VRRRHLGLISLTLLAAACSGGPAAENGTEEPSTPSASAPQESGPDPVPSDRQSTAFSPAPAKGSVEVTATVTTELDTPWGLAPLPEGDLLVSSRDTGKIFRISAESGAKTELGEVTGVEPAGEGGLLGIATTGADDYVYAYFTSASDNRVVRMLYDARKPEGRQLGEADVVFKGLPKSRIHNGGRIAFGPDRMLYVGTGDAGNGSVSQDKDEPAGKILRMTPDGDPPGHGNPAADSVVYSYGHRNVQGLDWDRQGRMWASEFGQNTWDELNLIEPGKNYGWPDAEGRAGQEGFVDPVAQWRPEDASPSGLTWAKGSLWMAGLRGERLWRIPLDETGPVAEPQAFLEDEYGRLRTVVSDGNDGLWLVTSDTDGRGNPDEEDDRILKLKVR
jgi:glucose/arabinose dehydrogenase